MGKYRRILVAVDGSAASLHALKASFSLSPYGITAAAVIPPYGGDLRLVGVQNIRKLLQDPYEQALAAAQELADQGGAPLKTVLATGEPHEEIVDLADVDNCDLVILGTKAPELVDQVLLSSMAARVIGYSRQDVLIMPEGKPLGWQKLLLPLDGSRYSKVATEKALDLALSYDGELLFMTATDLPAATYGLAPGIADDLIIKLKGFLKKITERASALGLKAEGLVRYGEAPQAVAEVARERQVNLIIMGSHGRTGLRRLLMGSVTEKVISLAPCPVLVVKH